MRIVISGASGSIGQPVVRDFLARGAQLLLVGRSTAKLRALFPEVECCVYEELVEQSQGYDGLLHLAVLNNDVSATASDFITANVELTKFVLNASEQAGIARFVYASTVQVLQANNQSPYAASKRQAAEHVAAAANIDARILHLSAVIGDRLTGRLAVLDHLPSRIRASLLEIYTAITPVTDIATVADTCWQALTRLDFPCQEIVARDQSRNIAFTTAKRGIDLVAALIILIPFSWLLVIIWLAIRIQSPGPGIFAQPRVGRNGKIFTCYKFRTMAKDTPNVGTHEASPSMVTPIGKVLRQTKLDELPQAYNILLNQMSLVGPRPCLPNQDAVIAERQKLNVLAVTPGITGLAQINHIDMSQPVLLAKWDAQYVRLQSLRLDLGIIVQTALGRGNGDAMESKNGV